LTAVAVEHFPSKTFCNKTLFKLKVHRDFLHFAAVNRFGYKTSLSSPNALTVPSSKMARLDFEGKHFIVKSLIKTISDQQIMISNQYDFRPANYNFTQSIASF
jgi:hypothetical protein